MADRYFVAQKIEGDTARLAGSEAHHLLHVMRAKVGDEVTLFDGGGDEFSARVASIGRAEVELTIAARRSVDRELSLSMTLGVALPKGERRRWLVEKAVELGVARLVPLETQRTGDRDGAAASARLRQAVIEASKQCGRNRLMEIAEAEPLAQFLTTADGRRLLAHVSPQGAPSALDEITAADFARREIALAVGPEGGFTDEEVELARGHGWRVVELGSRILRVETAALALAAAIMLSAERRT